MGLDFASAGTVGVGGGGGDVGEDGGEEGGGGTPEGEAEEDAVALRVAKPRCARGKEARAGECRPADESTSLRKPLRAREAAGAEAQEAAARTARASAAQRESSMGR